MNIREGMDQALHWLLAYGMARSLRGLVPRQDIIVKVMGWAIDREWKQHPDGDFGAGSMRDLDYWRKGAEKGAGHG